MGKRVLQVARSPDSRINTVVTAIKNARRNIDKRQDILIPVIPLLEGIDKMNRADALDLARRIKGEVNKDLTSRNPTIYAAAITADAYLQRFIISRAPLVDLHF